MSEIVSSSDNGIYPAFCNDAANSDVIFTQFRRHSDYQSVVETVSYESAREYLTMAISQTPFLKQHLKDFALSDTVGGPRTHKFRAGRFRQADHFSPTTLRYVKVLSDLITFFGPLDRMRIVEIGGGYGGLCKIIGDLYDFERYTLVDLPTCLPLASRFLSHFPIHHVEYRTMDQLKDGDDFDLLISNYAFSEIRRADQDTYVEKIVKPSRRGYMLCNFATHTWDASQYTEEELCGVNNSIRTFRTRPPLSKIDVDCGVSLLAWGLRTQRYK